MSLYDYHVFDTVVRQGSFSKASRVLHVTPSAISHIIAKLESDFGFPLLSRNRNGIHLTSDGETILSAVEELLLCEEQLNQEISDLNGIMSGTVRIAAFSSVTLKWLPDILASFKADFPQIKVRVLQGTYGEVASGIDSGAVDLAFVTDSYKPADGVELFELHREPLVCAMPKDFVTEKADSISADEMRGAPFLHHSSGVVDEIQEFIEEFDIDTEYEYVLDSDDAKLALVEKGLGICIMPEICVDEERFDIKALPITPSRERHIYLAVGHSRFLAPATEEMKKQILAYCEDL